MNESEYNKHKQWMKDNVTKTELKKTCDRCRFWIDKECVNKNLNSLEENGLYVVAHDTDWIKTGPKFGCIHWSPIEESK